MTVSTLDQISAYTSQTQSALIPQTSTTQDIQERSDTLNTQLLNAIGQAEIERTQRPSINPISMSDEARQLVTAVAGHNSRQQQLEIYINGMTGTDTYSANTIDASNLLQYDRPPVPTPLYA